jgi:glycosylphosphatidylinositol transamidase (GPIT) subunit GPI8
LDDGEHPLDLLPELQELTYSGNSNTSDVFTSFINARQNAGRPMILVRLNPSPDPSASATL